MNSARERSRRLSGTVRSRRSGRAFQAATTQKRNTFRTAQATDAATFRNTVAGAAKTHVDAVTTAKETLNNTIQDQQALLAQKKWDAWLALAQKAQLSADYVKDVKTAESRYYGLGPFAEYVNGAIIDHPNGLRGILDARRDYEVGLATAMATQNKALQAAAGMALAQARSSYETGPPFRAPMPQH